MPALPVPVRRTLRSYDSKNRLVTVVPGDGVGPEIVSSAIGASPALAPCPASLSA